MKKTLCMVLLFVMILVLTACGNTDASKGQKESSNLAAVHSEENQVTGQEPQMGEEPETQQDEVRQDGAGREMPQQEISGQEIVTGKESNESGAASPEEQESDMETKSLVVYFSFMEAESLRRTDSAILNRQMNCQDRNDPCPWETMCVRLLAWGHSFLSCFLPCPNAHRALR